MADAATPTPAPRPRLSLRERIDAYERLIRLDKPIGTLLLLWPTLSALWLAADGAPRASTVLVFCVGTLVMRSAGCAMNDWADRDFDAHVKRTAGRPLAAKEIAPWEALAVAAAFACCALLLVLPLNRTTILLSVPALLITATYPYCKRFFSLPQAFLGIAFSFGIPMAFASVYGEVTPLGWTLFAINLFWVMAYDTEYAMVDRDDDLKLGLRTSAITFGRFDVLVVMFCYAVYLTGLTWIGSERQMGPLFYIGVLAASLIALWHYRLIRKGDRADCFRAFLGNHWLGFAVFAGIVADYGVRLHRMPWWPQ